MVKGLIDGGTVTGLGQTFGKTDMSEMNKSYQQYANYGDIRPPVVNEQVDGAFTSGYSYKFKSQMDVHDSKGHFGIKYQDYKIHEHANLQLAYSEIVVVNARLNE